MQRELTSLEEKAWLKRHLVGDTTTLLRFVETDVFSRTLLDCKEQNEFQYDIGQILEWL